MGSHEPHQRGVSPPCPLLHGQAGLSAGCPCRDGAAPWGGAQPGTPTSSADPGAPSDPSLRSPRAVPGSAPKSALVVLHHREEPRAGHAASPCLWERDLGCFSPSRGARVCRAELQLSTHPCTPPARPAPRSPPALSEHSRCLRPYLYFNAASKPGAFARQRGRGQDRDGEITRGERHPPAERAAVLGEGWCLHRNSAPSLRAWDASHPTVGKSRGTGDPSAGSPPNLSAPTARGWGLQPAGNTHSSASR